MRSSKPLDSVNIANGPDKAERDVSRAADSIARKLGEAAEPARNFTETIQHHLHEFDPGRQ